MAKVAHWFKHDADSSSDPKLVEIIMIHGHEGYGIFWAIVEILTRQANYSLDLDKINLLARSFFMEESKLAKMMDDFFRLKLFLKNEGKFYSERHVKDMRVIKTKRNNGSKGAHATNLKKKSGENVGGLHGENVGEPSGIKIREDKNRQEKEKIYTKNILELRSCQLMLESVCMKNHIKPEKTKELLEIFISDQKGCDGLYRYIGEIKSHFQNWVPKYLQSPMLAKALNQKAPSKIVIGKSE